MFFSNVNGLLLKITNLIPLGEAIGVVIYTGPETRSVMNTSHPKTKVLPTIFNLYQFKDFFWIIET